MNTTFDFSALYDSTMSGFQCQNNGVMGLDQSLQNFASGFPLNYNQMSLDAYLPPQNQMNFAILDPYNSVNTGISEYTLKMQRRASEYQKKKQVKNIIRERIHARYHAKKNLESIKERTKSLGTNSYNPYMNVYRNVNHIQQKSLSYNVVSPNQCQMNSLKVGATYLPYQPIINPATPRDTLNQNSMFQTPFPNSPTSMTSPSDVNNGIDMNYCNQPQYNIPMNTDFNIYAFQNQLL